MENVKIKRTNFSNLVDSFCQHRSHYSREEAHVEALMTTMHAGCFRWYGKCKHMNQIWVTIERTCKRTAKKKIRYKQQIGIEHQDLQCKHSHKDVFYVNASKNLECVLVHIT